MKAVVPPIIACFVWLALGATASGQGDIGEAFAMGEPLTAAQRQHLAQKWRKDINRLNEAIPTLSPSQEEWLKREYDNEIKRSGNRFTGRALAAMKSREYNIRLAKQFASQNASIIAVLSEGKAVDRRQEAAAWALLAHNLMDREYGQAVLALVDYGVIDKAVLSHQDHYIENSQLWGQMILSGVLIPYLAGTQPD